MTMKDLEGYRPPRYDEIAYIKDHPPDNSTIGLAFLPIFCSVCIGMLGISYIIQGCCGVPLPFLSGFKEGIDLQTGSFGMGALFICIGLVPFIIAMSSFKSVNLKKAYIRDGNYKVLTVKVTDIRRHRGKHIAIKFITETGQVVEDWTVLCRVEDLAYYETHEQLNLYFVKFFDNSVGVVRKG